MALQNEETEKEDKILCLGRYFLSRCGKLPKGRLVKLFYLLDWKSALERAQTVTHLTWYYNHYGPYLPEVINILVKNGNNIFISTESNLLGASSDYISLGCADNAKDAPKLSSDEAGLADKVIAATKDLNFEQFIKLVYSTYPVRSSRKYSQLDLLKLAQCYKEIDGTNR